MRPIHPRRAIVPVVLSFCIASVYACAEAPPKIAAIPAGGLSLRVYAFGASAQETRRAFESARENNPSFSVVQDGGDGEVLVGLENDSPQCVPPTGLCAFRVSYRIKDRKGEVVHASNTTITASADRCSDLCAKAINNLVVKIVEAASGVLKGSAPGDGSSGDGGVNTASLGNEAGLNTEPTSSDAALTNSRAKTKSRWKAEAPKPESPICSVGAGPRLPSAEAEKRAAQVEVLKRLGVLEQDEYDCLRKAYLGRL